METVRGHRSLVRRLRAPAVAIGNFDGVHRGHVRLFAEARARATQTDAEVVVLTFDPHPAKVLAPRFAPPLITSLDRKLSLLAEAGIDVTVVEPFDAAFAALSPEAFVDQLLCRGLGATHVCVGYDFTFGARRAGTTTLLAELGRTRGFEVTVIAPVTVDGMVCSSTKIREFVLEGRVEGAALLLGRDPEVEGEVVRGEGRGRRLGVPTANLRPSTELLPKPGVYAGWAERPEGGPRFTAAINVGNNPTFAGDRPLSVEAHLLDVDLDLYGARLRLGFSRRLRDEQRFASKDSLLAQLRLDLAETRRLAASVPRA